MSNSSIARDVDRCCDSFLRQFNGMYHKCRCLDRHILNFLFTSYCMSLYGSEMWYDKLGDHQQYKRMSVSYHEAIKQMCGMKSWNSNHLACDNMNLYIFKHLLARRCYKFFLSIVTSESRCLRDLKYYFSVDSRYSVHTNHMFRTIYGVSDCLRNDQDALLSRICFVQKTEPRCNYVV